MTLEGTKCSICNKDAEFKLLAKGRPIFYVCMEHSHNLSEPPLSLRLPYHLKSVCEKCKERKKLLHESKKAA